MLQCKYQFRICKSLLSFPIKKCNNHTIGHTVGCRGLINLQNYPPTPRFTNLQNQARLVHRISRYVDPKTEKIGWTVSAAVILTSMYVYGKWSILLAAIPLFLFSGREVLTTIRMIPRDLIFLKRYLRLLAISKKIVRNSWTLNTLFNKVVAKKPASVMLQIEDIEWKYKQMDEYANKVSRLLQKNGYKKGDVLGVMLNNSPEMVGILLGASQLGVIIALLNTNLRLVGLAHCINISDCKMLIIEEDYINAIEDVQPALKYGQMIKYQLGGEPAKGYQQVGEELDGERAEVPERFDKVHHDDSLAYIYTSGTSGTPKAAIVPHSKFLISNFGSNILLGMRQSDKIYDPLPLYHTSGLIVGVGQAITKGIPVVIRKRFSASQYFPDCVKYNCTIAQYIGEICRFILMTDPTPGDTTHTVRQMLGNGLNQENWEAFNKRFRVRITELYGATEGNCNMLNIDGKIGAVGFLPKLVPFFLYPYYLIRVNEESQEPIRGPDGLCQKCDYDERGMLVGIIKDRVDTKYHGYKGDDKAATEAKILKDCFKKGDKVFVTGDILVVDEYLYFYFRDRTGDTFRWKGENVSTIDVETVAATIVRSNCACYGVKLKGYSGKAGMLAVEDPKAIVDVDRLLQEMIRHMPKYSLPRFVRIVDRIELTGTHKLRKTDLMKEGIDLSVIKDKLYYLDLLILKYKPLTPEVLQQILDHKTNM